MTESPTLKLKLPLLCADEREFRERYETQLSTEGLFIPAEKPKPVGTKIGLSLEFIGGTVGVSGDAVVGRHGDAGSRSGMRLFFVRLDPTSLKFPLHPLPAEAAAKLADVAAPVVEIPTVAPLPTENAAATPATVPSVPPALYAARTAERLFGDLDVPAESGKPEAEPDAPRITTPPAFAASSPPNEPAPPAPAPAASSPERGPPAPSSAPILRQGVVYNAAREKPLPAPPSPTVQAVKKGSGPAVALIALVCALVGGGLFTVKFLSDRAKQEEKAAALNQALATAEARLADARLSGPGGDEALDHVAKARAIDPEDPRVKRLGKILADTFLSFGERALARGDLAEAATHLEAALQADPNRDAARKRLAEVEERVRAQTRNLKRP